MALVARGLRGAALLLGLATGSAFPLVAQISPGPLARPHAGLEGPARCTQCHGGGREPMAVQCTTCHGDVAWLAARARGFHGTPRVKAQACESCHPDHAGLGFAMVEWPDGSRERFDHRRAGWALAQSHAEAACADCHTAAYEVSPAARLAAAKGGGGYTGLEPACASCHEDVHRGALESDCTTCHDAGRWTVTPGFDHDTTAYPLTGEHMKVECDDCHLAPRLAPRGDAAGRLVPVYAPVPAGTCAACHADPHQGSLGTACADCHSTRGFEIVDRERFAHDRTRYPLRGRHAAVTCAGCHGDFATAARRRPVFGGCASCHADAHNGTATLAGRPADCAACHGLGGFVPATYTAADHAGSRYPLAGRHATVACAACHARGAAVAVAAWGSARVVLRPTSAGCPDCHADPHAGRLARQPCESCHGVEGFRPSSVDVAAHLQFGFALEGAHRATPCSGCHAAGDLQFEAKRACADCHADPHGGEFAGRGAKGGCEACHTVEAFVPAPGFDHDRDAAFGLEGAHRTAPCRACHVQGPDGPVYRGLSPRCESCHGKEAQ